MEALINRALCATSQKVFKIHNTQIARADIRVRSGRSIVHINVAATFRAIVPIPTNKHVGKGSHTQKAN